MDTWSFNYSRRWQFVQISTHTDPSRPYEVGRVSIILCGVLIIHLGLCEAVLKDFRNAKMFKKSFQKAFEVLTGRIISVVRWSVRRSGTMSYNFRELEALESLNQRQGKNLESRKLVRPSEKWPNLCLRVRLGMFFMVTLVMSHDSRDSDYRI